MPDTTKTIAPTIGNYRDKSVFNKASKNWLDSSTYNSLLVNRSIPLSDVIDKIQIKHVVSNFIKIISGENKIEVEYYDGIRNLNTYTNSKVVTISADVKDFDFVTGLAMHEASHIIYSLDIFKFSEHLKLSLNEYSWVWQDYASLIKKYPFLTKLFKNHELELKNVILMYKNIVNFIEDRRIDNLVITKYPGYKTYYDTIYFEALLNPDAINGIKELDGVETWESYFDHLFCLMKPGAFNLNGLKGLQNISKLVDLSNISRLTTGLDTLSLAVDVYNEISKYVDNTCTQRNKKEITDKLVESVSGISSKTALNSTERNVMNILGDEKNKILWSKCDVDTLYNKNTMVAVIDELNESICNNFSGIICFRNKPELLTAVNNGILKGKVLANKLLLTLDDTVTTNNRKKYGKLDHRILSEIPAGNIKIFKHKHITSCEKTHIHITIDSSGSMEGARFSSALEVAAMYASASLILDNLEVTIDCRSKSSIRCISGRNSIYAGSFIYVAKIFNSKKHNLTYIKKWWPRLSTDGGTPEGLAFNAVKTNMDNEFDIKNKIFINISDGCPSTEAIVPTKNFIDGIKKQGYKVISYFISDGESMPDTFTRMYGQKCSHIVHSTMNADQVSKITNSYML